ncbi:MAG: potassium channel family protein [Ruegeria sp.]
MCNATRQCPELSFDLFAAALTFGVGLSATHESPMLQPSSAIRIKAYFMTLSQQIIWGSFYLGICFLIEIMLLTWCVLVIRKLIEKWETRSTILVTAGPISVALMFIVLTHTVQVWIWAIVWVWGDVLPDWNSALYFSLVTFTTLGYGDIVLGEGLRIFGAFASVTGLLAFGLSTAFLVALMTRVFQERFLN